MKTSEDPKNKTLLMLAAQYDRQWAIDELLQYEVDIDDNFGETIIDTKVYFKTALSDAIFYRKQEFAKSLIEHGAKVNICVEKPDGALVPALEFAKENALTELARLIEESQSKQELKDNPTDLLEAIKTNKPLE